MMMNTNLFLVLAWVALIATVSVSGRDQGLLRGQVHNEERELTAAVWSNDGFLSQYDNGPGPYVTGDSRRNSNGQNGVRVGVNGAYTGLAGGVNGAYIGLAGGVNGKSSNSRKSKSKSAPALPVDLPPKCEDVGDPVYGPRNPIPQPVLPSVLVRTMAVSPPPGEIVIEDTAGVVDIELVMPCFLPNTAFPEDAVWCAEGKQLFRITAHTTCLHSITDEYYFIKYVKTQGFEGSTAGECTLLRVSINAPGTWQEYQTPAMANRTAGAAIEWAYDTKPVDKRYKFSLCPNPEDTDKVKTTAATFVV
eukprot:CAMPEP_0171025788 /NCGR_PEP_ID=MMETSP0736-20130129/33859_1 /TAXON_ID=186038 /ORGANISM="Fragilariopsis kerguelensis, Strain L26-C5" /LENGTH=304 /DNA_ID=CAMNT_0011466127 /DNA_START=28 /DNA_END=942 /DNA_ORIENTATION=+